MSWGFTESTNPDGFGIFSIRAWSTSQSAAEDITFFRDVPVVIENMTWADPFGPATAMLRFDQCTGFDAPSGDTWFLKEFTNFDIVWIPASATSWEPIHGHVEQQIINPLTNSTYLYLHEYQDVLDPDTGTYLYQPAIWEGYSSNVEPGPLSVNITLQGALYQLDRYYAKPLYPYRPKFLEDMIARYFDPARRGLWTKPLKIDYTGWTKVYDQYAYNKREALGGIRFQPTPVVDAWGNYVDQNVPWLGYITRDTGNWEKALTGYVQSQLGIMYAKHDSKLDTAATPPEVSWGTNITEGDQWTITMDPGRQPRMYLRRQAKEPTLVAWYGQPGVDCSMTRDANQAYNVVFAQGKGPDDNAWSTQIMPTGNFSSWKPITPLEASATNPDSLYRGWYSNDLVENYDGYWAAREREEGIWVAEKMIPNFPSGVEYEDAEDITTAWVDRDSDPGWAGTITLQCDLRDNAGNLKSRWTIKEGDVILLKGFQGQNTAVQGVNKFHINQVDMRPMEGTVVLTVDTKFRDLLTVEWSMAAGRDTLSPIKALQVGKRSTIIQDLAAPWNNTAGSGFIPTSSKNLKGNVGFPYVSLTSAAGNKPSDIFNDDYLPGGLGVPIDSPNWRQQGTASLESALKAGKTLDDCFYLPVRAGASQKRKRWGFTPVLLSSAGNIARFELAAYMSDGQLAPVEFHTSLWIQYVGITNMPIQPSSDPLYDPSNVNAALFPGAFESVDEDGRPYGSTERLGPPGLMINGWGSYDSPCGYGKAVKTGVNDPDGTFVDAASWQFDLTKKPEYSEQVSAEFPTNSTQSGSAITAWLAIYAQIPATLPSGYTAPELDWVYFKGRMFREINIGTGS